MICKETIKQRKAVYGNNFPLIAKLQSEYFGFPISSKDVAMSLAILKTVRIDFIKSKLLELKQSPDFSEHKVQEEIKKLKEGLEDSLKDFENYKWIANNYEEYENL